MYRPREVYRTFRSKKGVELLCVDPKGLLRQNSVGECRGGFPISLTITPLVDGGGWDGNETYRPRPCVCILLNVLEI